MFDYKHARLRQLPLLSDFAGHICAFRVDKELSPIRLDAIRRVYRQVNALLPTAASAEDEEAINHLLEPCGWTWFPTDWYLVATDETEYWKLTIFGDDAQWVVRIEDVCLFDRRTKICICSATSNYELWHVAYHAVFRLDAPDAVRERVAELVAGEYAEPVEYVDCATLDRMVERDGVRSHIGEWPANGTKIEGYYTASGEFDVQRVVDEIVANLCEEGEI